MIVCRSTLEMAQALDRLRQSGASLALVPTMGYLHAGHLRLVARAQAEGHRVVLSIFVNPLQFGPTEDFARYPRDEARDLSLAEGAGVDVVYLPPVEDLLPERPQVGIHLGRLTETLCGPHRPGHFEGVAAIVLRLFGRVRPQVAYFGEKDAQQLAVLRRVVADLAVPVRLVGVATVREADGLALSSRNAYLSPEERRQALALYRSLQTGRRLLEEGERHGAAVAQAMAEVLDGAPGVRAEYAEVVDPDGLAPLPSVVGRTLLAVAAWVGPARLIDNLRLWVPAQGIPQDLVDDPEDPQAAAQAAAWQARVAAAVGCLPGRGAWAAAAVRALRGAPAGADRETLRMVLARTVGEGPLGAQGVSPAEAEALARSLAEGAAGGAVPRES